ncbi:hypothetical protein GN956_G10488 [Arapaima gigas]
MKEDDQRGANVQALPGLLKYAEIRRKISNPSYGKQESSIWKCSQCSLSVHQLLDHNIASHLTQLYLQINSTTENTTDNIWHKHCSNKCHNSNGSGGANSDTDCPPFW